MTETVNLHGFPVQFSSIQFNGLYWHERFENSVTTASKTIRYSTKQYISDCTHWEVRYTLSPIFNLRDH